MRTHGTPEQLETRRRLAVRLLRQGHAGAEVARMVGVRSSSMTRWKQAFEALGRDGLKPRHAAWAVLRCSRRFAHQPGGIGAAQDGG